MSDTFRVHQKRTAKISNSQTSTNHLGPLARHRVIYRFRRRTNHHGINYPFRELSIPLQVVVAELKDGLVPNLKNVLPRSVPSPPSFAPVSPQICSLYPIKSQHHGRCFLLRLRLTLGQFETNDAGYYQRTVTRTGYLEPKRAIFTCSKEGRRHNSMREASRCA